MKQRLFRRIVTYCMVLALFTTSVNNIEANTVMDTQEEVIEAEQSEENVVEEQEENIAEVISEDGTEENPYIIYDISDLYQINQNLSGYYILANNIDLGGAVWTPIGTNSKPFTGHIDGNGYTISNFNIESSESFTGFFGFIRNAEVLNLSLDNFQVEGVRYVGSLSGCAQGSRTVIKGCNVLSGTVSGTNEIGGIIGYGNCIKVTECTSKATVKSLDSSIDSNAGGILGYSYRTTVEKCSYSGVINSVGANAGGLAGFSYVGMYEECYSDGKITGTTYVGGLVGNFGTVGIVRNCFTLGEVTGVQYVGGISGHKGEIINCHFAGKINGDETVYGIGYNTLNTNCYFDNTINPLLTATSLGRETNEMLKQATFDNWDFDNVWKIVENRTYPYLKALQMPNDILTQLSIVTMSGTLINGKTGGAISGASVVVRYVTYDGETVVFDTVNTNSSGVFSIEHAVLGETYTLEYIADGYATKEVTVVCTGEVISVGTVVIIPNTSANIMTVILTWGANPSDLDTHFAGNNYHIYYSSKTANGAMLDLDDTSSYGPETLTLDTSVLPVGTYSYYIHWYSGSGTWANSGAKVEVFMGNDHIKSFVIPSSMAGSGGNWNVFNLNIQNNPNSVSSIDNHIATLVY